MPAQPPPLDPSQVGEDKGSKTTTVISIVAALSTLFAVARLWVRVRIMRQFQFDDLMIVVAVICGWMSVGFSTAAVHSGSGRHIQTLTVEEIQGAILFTLIGFVPGILSFVLPKLAVVKLLSRLLNPSRSHLIWLWFMCIFCLLTMMGSVGMVFGQCQPSNSQWDFSVPARFCWDKWIPVNYTRAVCAFSAFVDFYLSIYPGVVLCKIQLPTKKKVALSAALGIGSISTVVAIYKITVLDSLASVDFTYDSCDLTIWTIVEGSVIIIAACIPLLQPLLERVRNHPWSTKGTSQSTNPTPSDHQGYADIELSDKSRIRKIRRKFEMDSVLATRNNEEEIGVTTIPAGSQDRILEHDETGLVNPITGSQSHDNSTPSNTDHKIYRSDEIRISYARDEESGAGPHRYQDTWS
ncbi:hypothetical protein F4821DRAFT_116399 [Hypoxylon rubiginosum]|uniref:Uncharacterized protein n=1 Tax=Hypoxylon rubiginosum TaxID=110542 RepID=A0ACC0D3C3_9PEZI|nr:hypothetical protein F4821DRAFT_116399 [Hypoxylon rubiginosum]